MNREKGVNRSHLLAPSTTRNDTQGGRYAEWAMPHGTIAAVNMHVAAQAAVFIGLAGSSWTLLQTSMLQSSMLGPATGPMRMIDTPGAPAAE